jgi:hypothetical protein
MLYVLMTQPQLKSSRIVARVGQQMPAGMPEHVRVGVGESCAITSDLDHLGDIRPRHWPATFTLEYERTFGLSA